MINSNYPSRRFWDLELDPALVPPEPEHDIEPLRDSIINQERIAAARIKGQRELDHEKKRHIT